MSFVKKLAGETLIYGLSSILPRVVHYLFITSYITRKFGDTKQYGIYSEIYAYSSIILIFLMFRLDTAFFRFGSNDKDQEKIFTSAFLPVAFISVICAIGMYFFANPLAQIINYEHGGYYVQIFAFIMAFDALAGMFYARFRLQGRPVRFMIYRILNVFLTIILVFTFLDFLPALNIELFRVSQPVDNVFIANLIASAIVFLLMLPEMLKVKLKADTTLWKKMLIYSLPLVIVGVAGNINQVFAVVFQKFFLGGSADENLAVAGAYMGPARIALLLSLFTVAFNYAAEPFFFNNRENKDSDKAYGQIIHAFTIASGVIMIGIVSFQEIVILLIGEKYRGPQEIIPFLLFAYFFLGLYYNISIWYKLSDKTIYGALISVIGAVVTFLVNYLFLRTYGYIASAWAALACYSIMLVLGYYLGQRHYPIDYPVRKILMITFVILATMLGVIWIKSMLVGDIARLGVGLVGFLFFWLQVVGLL